MYLHVAVNHAVTDNASIVPLVEDLFKLHDTARSIGKSVAPCLDELVKMTLEKSTLPPAPNGLAVQEARLRGTLAANMSSDAIDCCHNAFADRQRGYDFYVRLEAGGCTMLEIGSLVIGVPKDHLLVTSIALAFASASK